MPYQNAFTKALKLFWLQKFSWFTITFICTGFSFFICPLDTEVSQQQRANYTQQKENEQKQENVKRLEEMVELVREGDPFTMGRLLRSEFKLRKKDEVLLKPSGDQ